MSLAGLVEPDGGENGEIMLPHTFDTLLSPLFTAPSAQITLWRKQSANEKEISSVCASMCARGIVSSTVCVNKGYA